MNSHAIVSEQEWIKARKKLLVREKEFTRLRDRLSEERRALPWVRVEKEYSFDDGNTQCSLVDLFGDKSQLMIYHFMLGPDWDEGCPSCSFWADNFNGIDIHLAHRDISFLAVSRAGFQQIEDYKNRMGWNFRWVSSLGSDFNYDYGVSFTESEKEAGEISYNYSKQPYYSDEYAGVSVFIKNDRNEIFHTYSTFARGLDVLNGAYNYIDLSPKGRDETDGIMKWLRRHDQYE